MAEPDPGIPDLTRENIAELKLREDGLMVAMDMCDHYGIPTESLITLDQYIERLHMHYNKLHGISPKDETEKSMEELSKENTRKRRNLIKMLEQLKMSVHTESQESGNGSTLTVQDILKEEGTTENLLAEDCTKQKAFLEHGECTILVAGESSAGKSSVLNLCLGEEILPADIRHATSVITVIRYGQRRRAKIIKKDESTEEFALDSYGLLRFWSVVFMEDEHDRETHDIREAHLFLPLKLLQSGLVFVDTPGIGENEFLEQELMSFISNNQILGFMYIIKTDAAGGVQEDRLLNLLKVVVESQRKCASSSFLNFDPGAALFVGNRFDLVQEAERECVMNHVHRTLSKCWPSFDESQMVFFSTSWAQANVNVDPDYITDDYKKVLKRLGSLYSTSMERRIISSFKWIEQILRRVMHHLKTLTRRLATSKRDLDNQSRIVRLDLGNLQSKADRVVKDLRATIDEKQQDVSEEIRIYLQQEKIKTRLTGLWTGEELPDPGLGNWNWIKEQIKQAFDNRVFEILGEWDEESEKIKTLEEAICTKVKDDFGAIEEDMGQIERKLQISRRGTFTNPLPLVKPEPALRWKQVGGLFRSVIGKRKVGRFVENPGRVAKEKSEKMFEELITSDTLVHFVQELFYRPRKYIIDLEKKIPALISANKRLLSHIFLSLEDKKEQQHVYETMLARVESLRELVANYGKGHIFVNDFMRSEIQMNVDRNGQQISVPFSVTALLSSDSMRDDIEAKKDSHGLWSVVLSGLLRKDTDEVPISLKVYLPSSGVKETFQEVAKLRCLANEDYHLAELLGIHHVDAPTPAFVYGGQLRSLRAYLRSHSVKTQDMLRILLDVASALEYLHSKDMVHMELFQDIITVDPLGFVCLTGACLPRKATLPVDQYEVEAERFVYIAPEVLRGDCYKACADIYSFGLLLLELLVPTMHRIAFEKQQRYKLYDFIQKVNPVEMLNLSSSLEDLPLSLQELTKSCLQVQNATRPLINNVQKELSVAKANLSYLSIRSNGPPIPPRRLRSKSEFRLQ